MLLISICAGIIPMVIYATFLFWMDRHEREPLALVVSVFLWGFIPAAIFSLISQILFSFPFLIVDPSGAVADVVGTVLLAPVTEEIFKGAAVLLVYLFISKEFDSVFDGILYGGIVGFGFAAVENILYFMSTPEELGFLIFFRAFVFGLNHAFYTSLTGIGFGLARHSAKPLSRFGAPLLGLVGAILAHMFHNGSLVLGSDVPILCIVTILGDYIGIIGIFVVMFVALRRERQWIENNLRDEVPHVLSPAVYGALSQPMSRFMLRTNTLSKGGLSGWWQTGRYFDSLVDLAYKKQLQTRRGEETISSTVIEDLRQKAVSMLATVTNYLT